MGPRPPRGHAGSGAVAQGGVNREVLGSRFRLAACPRRRRLGAALALCLSSSSRRPLRQPAASARRMRHVSHERQFLCICRKDCRDVSRVWQWRPIHVQRPSADTTGVDHVLADTIDSEILLDQRIRQSRRAEWRETQSGCDEAERLTEVAGLQQHVAVRPRRWILPVASCKYRRHHNERGRLAVPGLTREVSFDPRPCTALETDEAMFERSVVIEAGRNTSKRAAPPHTLRLDDGRRLMVRS